MSTCFFFLRLNAIEAYVSCHKLCAEKAFVIKYGDGHSFKMMNRDGVLDDNWRKTGYSNKRALLENYIKAGYRVL